MGVNIEDATPGGGCPSAGRGRGEAVCEEGAAEHGPGLGQSDSWGPSRHVQVSGAQDPSQAIRLGGEEAPEAGATGLAGQGMSLRW